MTVPVLSVVFMFVSLVLSIGTPIALFLLLRRKFALKVIPSLVGAAAFIVFAMILERLLHAAVLAPNASGEIVLMTYPYLYALYGCFAAGIFEETARFISLIFLKKKYTGFGTALSYGIGHGGVEAVLISGLAMINNIIFSIMLNTGAGEAVPQFLAESLGFVEPVIFLISGVERLIAITAHISLSIIVYYAVKDRARIWLYPLAIFLHALVNLPAGLFQSGIVTNVIVVELATLVTALILLAIAGIAHRKFKA